MMNFPEVNYSLKNMRLVFCLTQHILMNKILFQECLPLSYQFAGISVVYLVYYIHTSCFKVFLPVFSISIKMMLLNLILELAGVNTTLDRRGWFSFSKISKLSWFQNVQIYATELLYIFYMINQISKTSWLLRLKRCLKKNMFTINKKTQENKNYFFVFVWNT